MKVLNVITGTSSGIGHALAMVFLNKGESVLGVSRSKTIEHENYHHQFLDLSETSFINRINWSLISEYTYMNLVNNAGGLGEIKHMGNKITESVIREYNLNIIAPVILSNEFLKRFGEKIKTIINISSGAANSIIDGWSVYCSSKSALDRYSENLQNELLLNGSLTKVYSIAPGVVDTPMQEVIRRQKESNFSRVEYFQKLKTNNELFSPQDVSKLIDEISTGTLKVDKVVLTLRDYLSHD